MNRIDKKLEEEGKLLSIYFTAGYPNLNDTKDIIKILKDSKIDYIEAFTLEDAANKAVKALKELG